MEKSKVLAESLLPDSHAAVPVVGFGGYHGASRVEPAALLPSSSADPDGPVRLPPDVDGQVQQHLRRLGSKDQRTKLEALSTLSVLFAQKPGEEVVEIVPQWAFEYKRLLLDYNREVRRATIDTMSSLVTAVKKDLDPHLQSLMGPWWFSQFDPAAEVAQAARRSFEAAFPQSDRRLDALTPCVKETFLYLNENLKLTTQALSDKVTPVDELEDIYQRVISSSLLAMAALIDNVNSQSKRCSKVRYDAFSSAEASIDLNKCFIDFLKSKVVVIQSATYTLLTSYVKFVPHVFNKDISTCSSSKELVSGLYSILFSSEPIPHLHFAAYSLLMSEPLCQLSLVKGCSLGENYFSSQESDMGQSIESTPDSEEVVYLRDELLAWLQMPTSELTKTDLTARERVNVFVAWALVLSGLLLLPQSSTTREKLIQYIEENISPCILDCLFQHIPVKTAAPSGKSKDVELVPEARAAAEACKNAMTTSSLVPYLENFWPAGVLQMASLAGSLYGMMIRQLCSYVHVWFTNLSDRSLSYSIESFTKAWCSPTLQLEFPQVDSVHAKDDAAAIAAELAAASERCVAALVSSQAETHQLRIQAIAKDDEVERLGLEILKLHAQREIETSEMQGRIEELEEKLIEYQTTCVCIAQEKHTDEEQKMAEASRPRQQRLPWTTDEESFLKRAVSAWKEGNISWVDILEQGKHVFHPARTSTQLKNKYQNMKKQGIWQSSE